ncbi:MAG: hypothetical protein Q4C12_00130 [Clostridia bacterium]|nr:hypothetical protein [Clostridia bacterium]
MKNEMIQKLGAVINALNNVYVKGEQNLANLSGSITILKEVAEQLNIYEVEEKSTNKE